jgi:hypothetical protein
MRLEITIATLAVAFSFHQASAQIYDGSNKEISEAKRLEVIRRVSPLLRDPDSAQFRNLHFAPVRIPPPGGYCGEVNEKVDGQFVGYVPFLIAPNEEIMILRPKTDSDTEEEYSRRLHFFRFLRCIKAPKR